METFSQSDMHNSTISGVRTPSTKDQRSLPIIFDSSSSLFVKDDLSRQTPTPHNAGLTSSNFINSVQRLVNQQRSNKSPERPFDNSMKSPLYSRTKSTLRQMLRTPAKFSSPRTIESDSIIEGNQSHSLRTQRQFLKTPARVLSEKTLADFYLANKTFTDKPRVSNLSHNASVRDLNRSNVTPEPTFSRQQTNPNLVPDYAIREAYSKVKLESFLESLPPSLKEFYNSKRGFKKIFEDYDLSNFCLREVVDKVKAYRPELGAVLVKSLTTQQKIYERTLESAMKVFIDQEEFFKRKLADIRTKIKDMQSEKDELEEKNKQLVHLLNIAEGSGKLSLLNIEKLESELKISHEILQNDLKAKTTLYEDQKRKDQEVRKQLGFGAIENEKTFSDRLQSDISHLQDFFEELDREHVKKAEIIKDMGKYIKASLKKMKCDVGTQVDEGDLTWAVKHLGENKAPTTDEILHIGSSAINIENAAKININDNKLLQHLNNVEVLSLKEKEKKVPDEKQIEDTKKVNGSVISLSKAHSLMQEFEDNWSLPINMVVLLDNVTRQGEAARVLPWNYFRKIIFEIYNDRLANRVEVQHSLVPTYVPMNEYVCIYLMKKHRMRRVTELKLLELLVSLKYFVKIWPRALAFANMCGITSINKLNDLKDVTSTNEWDIYTQNFFLFAYEKIMAESESIIEHSEGTSWLLKKRIEPVVNHILGFVSEVGRKKIVANLLNQIRFIGEGPDKDAEGLDIDKFLIVLVGEYMEAKKMNLKQITKNFYKNTADNEKILSMDDFAQHLQGTNTKEYLFPNLIYPKDVTVCRAFLYALTSEQNNFAVSYSALTHSVTRFGLDSPFPFIEVGGDAALVESNLSAASIGWIQSTHRKTLVKKKTITLEKKMSKPALTVQASQSDNFGGLKRLSSSKIEFLEEPIKTRGLKLDAASALFARQFSLIREMKNYCQNFTELINEEEQDEEAIMTAFRQLSKVLEKGCMFLSVPVDVE